MTDMKFGFRLLIGVALIGGTALLASCGEPDRMSRTTTTEQSATTMPVAPTTSTTVTTQQYRP